jgi:hypothetical protein
MENEGYFVLAEGAPIQLYCNVINRLMTSQKRLFGRDLFVLCSWLILDGYYVK